MNHHQRRRFDRGIPASSRSDRSGLVAAYADAVRDNPMAAALIGVGALWFFSGGNRVSLLGHDGRTSVIGAVAHGAGEAAHGASHLASRMGSAVASTVSSAAGSIGDTVSSASRRAGEYVGGSMHGVDAEAEYRNGGGCDDEYAYRSRYADQTSSNGSLRKGLQDLFERHPLALGLAGLAMGAAIAASLPLTETEREAGEAVRSKISETASQAKDIAGAVAEEVRRQTS